MDQPQEHLDWLAYAYRAAKVSGHIFPDAAAAEAALESSWGQSRLALRANNLFGRKSTKAPCISMPTREFLKGAWVTVPASWAVYPTIAECFEDRMELLHAEQAEYPHYAAALVATSAEEFLKEVSQTWSTDPLRGEKCLAILHAHKDILC